jgi:hypothetical protein
VSYTRAYLERLLVQDFGGCTWEAARRAVMRYQIETGNCDPAWWYVYPGDPYAVTEWIAGTSRYWLPKGKRWKVQLPEGYPWQ